LRGIVHQTMKMSKLSATPLSSKNQIMCFAPVRLIAMDLPRDCLQWTAQRRELYSPPLVNRAPHPHTNEHNSTPRFPAL
jgi:hypothetical protein